MVLNNYMLIQESDWATIKYFKPEEFGPLWRNMDYRAIRMIDQVRDILKKPITIHAAFETEGHVSGSLHGVIPCTAIDGHIKDMHLMDQYLFLERFPYTGIGLYPHWNSPGWHVDLRLTSETCVEQAPIETKDWRKHKGARWIRDDKTYNKPVYVALNAENLKRLNII
jgi:hypothetical protein